MMARNTIEHAIKRLSDLRKRVRQTDDFKDAKWRLGLTRAIRELRTMQKESR